MMARAGTKDYGAYTVKLRQYVKPTGRFAVSPGNFFPPPRVESAVIRLERIESGLTEAERAAACLMADAAFATRRKTIANSCKTFFGSRGEQGRAMLAALPQLLSDAGIDARSRGESLSVEQYQDLGRRMAALQVGGK
jgi:16S rRNA (adenine1518-N6/adenine1519-N6)-dimethyltransferase